MIPAWLPVAVPWAGAALLAALPRAPAAAGAVVAALSLAAAVAWFAGGAPRPDALGPALLLAGAAFAFLVALAEAGAAGRFPDGRAPAAGYPVLQGAQALALSATDPAFAWVGLAVAGGAGAALVAASGDRRGAAAAWRMLLIGGAGLALALLGVAMAGGVRGGAPATGLSALGFVLLLLGYGALAGLAPLNDWLPRSVASAPPPVAAAVAGLLPPAALHALVRAMAAGPEGGPLPPAALLAGVGAATALAAARAAWRRPGAGAKGAVGWCVAGLMGFAAVGFGLGGAAGGLAGVLLLVGAPFCTGAALLGPGGRAGALGRAALAGMPPFAPFVALALLLSAVAALRPGLALPLGAVVLAATAAQLGAAGRPWRGAGSPGGGSADRGLARLLLVSGPPWVLLGLALALGAALPERVAGALAEAARLAR